MNGLPDPFPVLPADGPLRASVRPPGSKSLTCRLYVLAALAEGRSLLRSPLRSGDTDRLLAALETLGVRTRWRGSDVEITGCGGRLPRGGRIDLGDGGTPTRFMIAAACLASGPVLVDGSPRMRERPIAEGVEMLRALGAHIEYVEEEGRLPVRITPSREFTGGEIAVGRTASSQFISALLLIGPFLRDGVSVRYTDVPTSPGYIALTRLAMRQFGVEVRDKQWLGPRIDQVRPVRVEGRELEVEADASSAAYWLVAGAIVPDSRVRVEGLRPSSTQPDAGLVPLLERAGAEWTVKDGAIEVIGPERLRPLDEDLSGMPDGAMAVAILAACATGRSRLRGLETLRVKETDRLAALATELTRVGCEATADSASLVIHPHDGVRRDVVIETYNDHRMAMAFAVLGLVRRGIAISDPGCVSKSYPGFWNDLAMVRAGRSAP